MIKDRRTQESRSAETRERLIRAAVAVIARRGYAGSTTNEIAEYAGVSRGALQHQFGSRHELMAAVVDSVMADVTMRLRNEDVENLSVRDRLELIVSTYWDVFSGPVYRAALNVYLGSTTDPELKSLLDRHLAEIHSGGDREWRDMFRDVDLDPEDLLSIRRIVVATIRGYAVLGWGEIDSRWPNDRAGLVDFALSRFPVRTGGPKPSRTRERTGAGSDRAPVPRSGLKAIPPRSCK